MTYTPTELVTIMTAVGVLLAALGSVIVSIIVALRNGTKTDNVGVVAQAALDKTGEVSAKIDQVHVLTNSNLKDVKAELAVAAQQIANLIAQIADLKSEREKVSVAAALATPPPRTPRATDQTPVIQQVEIVGAAAPVPVEIIEHSDKPNTRGDPPVRLP